MKSFISLCFGFLLFQIGFAQEGIPKSQPLKIESKTPTDIKITPEQKKPLSLNMPDLLSKKKDSLEPKISMLPNKELVQAGADLKLDPKIGEKKEGTIGKHFPDLHLGDIKNNGEYIHIVCRDFGAIDGDLVKIIVNDVELPSFIKLTEVFVGINADIKVGFNKIEFIAVDEGALSPATAQFNVYDDHGKLIYANQWWLSEGSKATFIVIKE